MTTTTRSRRLRALAGAGCAALALVVAGAARAGPLPGAGRTVRPARATWRTGWFQTEIYVKAIEALGYDVKAPRTLDNAAFYRAVGAGGVDFWVNGWFPLHQVYRKEFEPGARTVGYVAKGGALQGYLVDKRTADAYHITSIDAFKDPRIRELFDASGDGKADLVACPERWGCNRVIEHQLDAYGLRPFINPVKSAYAVSMANAVRRFDEGRPIFFYAWTPSWAAGELRPGRDVVWLEVPFVSLPADEKAFVDETTVAHVTGCADDPCKMGWPANDIRPVANEAFLKANPAIERLFQVMRIPVQDILDQNVAMNAGADSSKDLERQANDWIAQHRARFDRWLAAARKAAM